MANSLITQTFGVPSQGEIEAGCAFETKRRELEHQFDVTNSWLREEYLLEIHESSEAKMTGVTH